MARDPDPIGHRRNTHGLLRWFGWSDHKDVGVLYLITGAFTALLQLAGAVYRQAGLNEPGVQYLCHTVAAPSEACGHGGLLQDLLIQHGPLLLVISVFPAVLGLGNHALPGLIGARNMAVPRLNMAVAWMFVAAVLIGVTALLLPGYWAPSGPAREVGWVLASPVSLPSAPPGTGIMVLAISLAGIALALTALNLIVTFVFLRASDMPLRKVPLSAWTIFFVAWLVAAALPTLTGAAITLLT
jgi:cytochrome c oxidase subunit 1